MTGTSKHHLIAWAICSILVIATAFVALPAKAQKGKKGSRSTTINFEDELIEGEVKKPELLYLLQKKQFNFKKLIKLRENFLPEMQRTAEDL